MPGDGECKDEPPAGRRRSTGEIKEYLPRIEEANDHRSQARTTSDDALHPREGTVRYMPIGGAISEPPKFPAEAYEEYRRNLRFWKEINSYCENGQLVAKLAMRSEGALEITTARYLRDTSEDTKSLSADDIISKLDVEFDRPSQEIAIEKINDLMSLSRRSGEDIRLFWIRFDKARMAVELSDTVLADAVLYSRALNALKLSGHNRSVLLSGLEEGGALASVKTLKEVSVKIFGSSIDESTKIALETVDGESKVGQEEAWG